MEEFARIIRPGKKLDKDYLVLRDEYYDKYGKKHYEYDIIDEKLKSTAKPVKWIAKVLFTVNGEELHLVQVQTQGEYKRLGFGTFLIKLAEQDARRMGLKKINVDSTLGGAKFYPSKKAGFKTTENTLESGKGEYKKEVKSRILRFPKIRTFAGRDALMKRRRK